MNTPSTQDAEDTAPATDERLRLGLLLCLVLVTGLAYARSFSGVFLLDDVPGIERVLTGFAGGDPTFVEDPLGHLRTPDNRRLLTDLTLLGNHTLGGRSPWGYHLVNLLVHLGVGMVLFGLVRRTLLLPGFQARFERTASWFAFVAALVWSVHPLCTQAVTYVAQRAESLMALFYLLTLYALLRGSTAPRSGRTWIAVALLASLFGAASKEVMITAPIALLAYDFVFLGRRLPGTGQVRRALHGVTWLGVFGYLSLVGIFGDVLTPAPGAARSVGLGFKGASWFEYLLTQCEVLLHYLRLALWPTGQVFDYGWEFVRSKDTVILEGSVLIALVLVGLVLLARRHWAGFCAFGFFLILAPTSSVIPLEDAAFEYRMYLPLAFLVVLVLGTVAGLLKRIFGDQDEAIRTTGGLAVAVALALALTTHARNAQYQSEQTMWIDVATKRPGNTRAARMLAATGMAVDPEEALRFAQRAVQLDPRSSSAYYDLGSTLHQRGELDGARAAYERAIQLDSRNWKALANLGELHINEADMKLAVQTLQAALAVRPDEARIHYNLGYVQQTLGNFQEAIRFYGKSSELDPRFLDAAIGKALCLESVDEPTEAEATLREAMNHADPKSDRENLTKIHTILGNLLLAADRLGEAAAEYKSALVLDPEQYVTWSNLGLVLQKGGRPDQAAVAYRRALEIEPGYERARLKLEQLGL